MVRLIAATVAVVTGTVVTITGPAQAAGPTPGWYGSDPTPFGVGSCSDYGDLATGSDGEWISARVCIRAGLESPPHTYTLIMFENSSHSNVVAFGNRLAIWTGKNQLTAGYNCPTHTVYAHSTWYCLGYFIDSPSGLNVYAQGSPGVVNAYSKLLTSGVVRTG